jgi:hypothetical protein
MRGTDSALLLDPILQIEGIHGGEIEFDAGGFDDFLERHGRLILTLVADPLNRFAQILTLGHDTHGVILFGIKEPLSDKTLYNIDTQTCYGILLAITTEITEKHRAITISLFSVISVYSVVIL